AAPLLAEDSVVRYDPAQSIVPFGTSGTGLSGKIEDSEPPMQPCSPPVKGEEHQTLDTLGGNVPGVRTSIPERVGRYRISGPIGRGGMSIVYKALDEALERVVALKMLGVGLSTDDSRKRFRREAQAVARVQHPNIVQIYDTGEFLG